MFRIGARLTAVAALSAMMSLAAPAHAESEPDVIARDPASRAQTDVPPGRVTVAFTENVRQKDATIVVKDSSDRPVSSGAFVIEGNNIYVDLDYDIPRGTYTVQYRATTTSGTPFGGSYQFAYGKGVFVKSAFSTWTGSANIPPDVRLPIDDDPSATPSSAEPSDAATPDSDAGVADQSDKTDSESAGHSTSPWAYVLAGVFVLAACLGAAWWWAARRKTGE